MRPEPAKSATWAPSHPPRPARRSRSSLEPPECGGRLALLRKIRPSCRKSVWLRKIRPSHALCHAFASNCPNAPVTSAGSGKSVCPMLSCEPQRQKPALPTLWLTEVSLLNAARERRPWWLVGLELLSSRRSMPCQAQMMSSFHIQVQTSGNSIRMAQIRIGGK